MTLPITVLLNAYVRMSFIEESLASILNQQANSPFELVLLNANKDWPVPDSAQRLAKERGIEIIRVTVPPGPVGQGLHLGAAAAHGDVVAILDDDDLWEQGKIMAVEAAFRENPKLALFHNGQTFVDQLNKPISPLSPHRLVRHPSSLIPEGRRCLVRPDDLSRIPELLALEPMFNNSSIVIRRSILQSLGDRVAPLPGGEDTFLFLCALATGGELLATSDRLTRYRIHSAGSASGPSGVAASGIADSYAGFVSRHLESLQLLRRVLSSETSPLVLEILEHEEAYYSLMRNLTCPQPNKSSGNEIRKLLSRHYTPPSLRSLGAASLGLASSVSSKWASRAFLTWRMAW